MLHPIGVLVPDGRHRSSGIGGFCWWHNDTSVRAFSAEATLIVPPIVVSFLTYFMPPDQPEEAWPRPARGQQFFDRTLVLKIGDGLGCGQSQDKDQDRV